MRRIPRWSSHKNRTAPHARFHCAPREYKFYPKLPPHLTGYRFAVPDEASTLRLRNNLQTVVLNEDKKETESSQDSAGTEEDASASTGMLAQNVDIKVLEVTPTSLKVRLTNNGDEDISFGDDYEGIEVYDETTDTWMECQKQYEIACYDILHFVKSGDKQNWFDWYVDWANVYGSLGAGHYRLQKNISIGNIDGGDQYVQLIQIEFDVR